jgi:hypothetical protein
LAFVPWSVVRSEARWCEPYAAVRKKRNVNIL